MDSHSKNFQDSKCISASQSQEAHISSLISKSSVTKAPVGAPWQSGCCPPISLLPCTGHLYLHNIKYIHYCIQCPLEDILNFIRQQQYRFIGMGKLRKNCCFLFNGVLVVSQKTCKNRNCKLENVITQLIYLQFKLFIYGLVNFYTLLTAQYI